MTKSNLTTAVAGALLALFCAALLPTSGAADWIKRPTAIRNLQTTTMDPGDWIKRPTAIRNLQTTTMDPGVPKTSTYSRSILTGSSTTWSRTWCHPTMFWSSRRSR